MLYKKAVFLIIIVTFGVLAITPAIAQDNLTAQTTHRLNVRTGPDLTNAVIVVLAASTSVTLEGRDADGGWALISTETDVRGWVSLQYLALAEGVQADALPLIETSTASTTQAAATGGETITTTVGLNLREGPGEEYEVIVTLFRGTEVVIDDYSADTWWAQVHTTEGYYKGWVVARFLADAQAPPPAPAEETDPAAASIEAVPAPTVHVSGHAREIYLHGLEMGNNPRSFSAMGSCNSRTPFFLASFDAGTYNLGPYAYLQPTIDHFSGSFSHWNQTVMGAGRTWFMFDETWSDPDYCEPGETPITCEYRLNRPSVVFISFSAEASNESYELFTSDMRAILEFWIARGVIPILGTQAHGGGENQSNAIIAQLAAEYDVPLWDFWTALQGVPDSGLQPDGFHLSWHQPDYTNQAALQTGWGMRNLTALQALDAVWHGAMQ